MFVFHFRVFHHELFIESHSAENTPSESGIILYYSEKGDLSKHEILKRFYNNLKIIKCDWIRPINNITNEWLIDLKQLKYSFKVLENTKYLKHKITLEPEYMQEKRINDFGDLDIDSTMIKFTIYPEDTNDIFYDIEIDNDLVQPLKRFKKDYPDSQKCCFLMMKFEDSNIQSEIVKILKSEFQKKGLHLLRADDKIYSDDLFQNIKAYMHHCSFGISLFERINSNYFNPNVSLEVGYMMALKKPILFLKDKTLNSLHTDLVGKLYYEFDFQNSKKTIPKIIDKWLSDNDLI